MALEKSYGTEVIESTETKASAVDEELLRRIVGRDVSALGELYDRHSNQLYSVVFHILNDSIAADEALVETFRQVWEKPESHSCEHISMSTCLIRKARDIAVGQLRSTRPETNEEGMDLLNAGALLGRNGESPGALTQLSSEELSLIELAFFRGKTRSELAGFFGLTPEEVTFRIHDGISHLSAMRRTGESRGRIDSLYVDQLAALDAVGALDGEDITEFKRISPNVGLEAQKVMAGYCERVATFALRFLEAKHPPIGLRERLMRRIG